MLQYTSGSTTEPKGVMLSHRNLLYNHQMMQTAMRLTNECIYVTWLPLFHDMGLIGNVLQSLYLGARCVLMPPAAFVQRPIRWLRAISRYRATTSGGPNFAYEMCIREITTEQRSNIDLSNWKAAFNGAEPVRASTIERFSAAFGPVGFCPRAWYPCYGLAEATLFVSGGVPEDLPVVYSARASKLEQNRVVAKAGAGADSRELVGCGRAWLGERVVIARPEEGTRCAPDEVGEIWVSGPNVAQGYWSRPEETNATFRAYLEDTAEGPFLRTGDLGFLKNGELFVTGRLKDLIIIDGRNHYPQDIERTVEESNPRLVRGCCAAFAIDAGGEERLVVVVEVDPPAERNTGRQTPGMGDESERQEGVERRNIVGGIRKAVAEQHEVSVFAAALVRRGSIPKTPSGKIQRRVCRERFLSGKLRAYSVAESETTRCISHPQCVRDSAEGVGGCVRDNGDRH
jgi:acyl-CoA synthetase (AMP-forming)/AMP-acid ligase II